MAISPNGQQILTSASVYDTGNVYLWDTATGKEIRRYPIPLKGGSRYCIRILFSPDGRSALLDANGLRLWEVATGKEILQFEAHKGLTGSAAFSPDGRWVLTGDADKTARLWEVATGKESARFEGHSGKVIERHSGQVIAVAFSSDGKQAFTVCGGQVRLWDVASGAMKNSYSLDKSRSYGDSPALSPDGKLLLTKGFLWDIAKGKVIYEFSNTTKGNNGGEAEFSPDAVFSPDGKQIYIACDDGTARLWNSGSLEREPVVLEGKTDSIESVSFSSDGTQVLIGNGDGTTRLRNLATGKVARTFQGHVGILSPDGKRVITGPPTDNFENRFRSTKVDFKQQTRLWDVASGKELGKSAKGSPLCISPDGKKALFFSRVRLEGQRKDIAGLTRMCLEVWDTANGNKIQEIPLPLSLSVMGSVIRSAAFSADGKRVAFAAWDQGAWLWDWNNETIRSIGYETGKKTAVAFSPDGKQLLIGGEDRAVLVRLGDKVQKIGWPGDAVDERGQRKLFAFGGRADDKIIQTFSVGSDGQVRVGGVIFGRDMVNSVAFSPDGKQVITGHFDSTARLWSVEDGRKELRAFSGHEGAQVRFVAFSPDGKKVLTAGSGGEIRLWEAASGRELLKMFNFRDSSWVALTPGDNYYLASRGRLDGICFAVNTRVFPFEQFDLKFNRPDKVIEGIGLASNEIIAAYRHAYQKRLKRMNFTEDMLSDDFHVPEVAATSDVKFVTREKTLKLKVNANDSKYLLDRLYVDVNGVPLHGSGGIGLRIQASKTSEQEIEIELSAGKNKIDVSVLNEKGAESLKETIAINCDAPAAKPNLYVVAVGVSDYADARFRLTYADKDARDLADLFESKRDRFGEIKVQRILNGHATRENILKAKDFLKTSRVDDLVVVFFAGHGLLDNKLDYYFATADIDFKDPAKRGLSYEAIEDLLDGIRARKKVLLMDTCHSGELDKDEVQIARSEKQPEGEIKVRSVRGLDFGITPKVGLGNSYQLLQEMFADLRRGTGAVVIASAGGAEYAPGICQRGRTASSRMRSYADSRVRRIGTRTVVCRSPNFAISSSKRSID